MSEIKLLHDLRFFSSCISTVFTSKNSGVFV